MSGNEVSMNSQPVHTDTNLKTGNLFAYSRLKSPTKLKSAKKRETTPTPYKMQPRRDKNKRMGEIMGDLLRKENEEKKGKK